MTAGQVLAVGQLVAYSALIFKLVAARLIPCYPWFAAYAAFEFIRSALNFWLPKHTDLYAQTYFMTQPGAWILSALAVHEVFRVTLRSHPGISTLGRRTLLAAVGCAAFLASLSLVVASRLPQSPFTRLEQYVLLERAIYSSLLVFLLTLLTFLAVFPVPLSKNALWHAGIFGLYFLVRTGLWAGRNLAGPQFTTALNIVMSATAIAVVVTWALVLTRAGEKKTILSSRRADKTQEEKLMAQLDRLNATLVSSGRK